MNDYEARINKLIAYFSAVPLLLYLLAIINWGLRALNPQMGILFFLRIAPTTALSGFLLSTIVFIRTVRRQSRALVDSLLIGIVVYCLTVIGAYFVDYAGHPDTLFTEMTNAPDGSLMGAMSALTALLFVLLTIVFFIAFAEQKPTRMGRVVCFVFSISAFTISLIMLYSSVSGVRMIAFMNSVPMSQTTAISLIILSLAFLEKIDRGILHLLRFLSGLSRDDSRGRLNQMNVTVFTALVLVVSLAAIIYLRMESRTFKMSMREQVLLTLDAKTHELEDWLDQRFKMVQEVRNNTDLQRGMQVILQGDTQSHSAIYALTWMHIVFQQNPGCLIALFDPENDITRSAPPHPQISKTEQLYARKMLKDLTTPFVEASLDPDPGEKGNNTVEYLRYWTSLQKNGEGPLLLLQLRPSSYLEELTSSPVYATQLTSTVILAQDKRGYHFLTQLRENVSASMREKIRRLMSSNMYRARSVYDSKLVFESYDYRGRLALTAVSEVKYLPWLIVQSIDLEELNSSMLGKSWLIFALNIMLLFGAAMFMNYSSRQKMYRDNLQVSNQWRATFDAVPDVIWLLDENLVVRRTNQAVQNILGLDPQSVIGKSCTELIPEDTAFHSNDAVQDHYSTVVNHQGRWLSISSTPLMDSGQDLQGSVYVVGDITSQRQNLEMLQSSEERFRAIFDRSPIGIALTDAKRQFLRVNASFTKFLGYSEEELRLLTIKEVTHPDFVGLDQDLHDGVLRGDIPHYQREKKFIRKDGTEIWGMVTVVRILDTLNDNIYLMGMIENIQDRVLAMQELYRAKERAVMSEKLKSSFMQNMSHEFRTPMNGIMGFSQLLIQAEQSPESVREFAGYIQSSGRRMMQLIGNILDFAKIDSGQEAVNIAAFGLNQLMHKIFDLYKAPAFAKDLELSCVVPNELTDVEILSDEHKLMQIMAKAMDNAINFTTSGMVELSCQINHNILILKVKDTGLGIAPQDQSRIFDSFFQADMSITRPHDGAGLGLPICKGLAKLLGGDISIVSELGRGTEFILTVPIKITMG